MSAPTFFTHTSLLYLSGVVLLCGVITSSTIGSTHAFVTPTTTTTTTKQSSLVSTMHLITPITPTATTTTATTTTTTRLYGYDEEYAKYYPPLEPDSSFEPPKSLRYLEQLSAPRKAEEEGVTMKRNNPVSGMSYLESLSSMKSNDGDDIAASYASIAFSSSSTAAPPPAVVVEEPASTTATATTTWQQQPIYDEPEPFITMASTFVPPVAAATVVSTPPPAPPVQQQQQQQQSPPPLPLIADSSPTLSASSPTISITIPLALRPPKIGKAKNIEYGERSRTYRRTVYSHEDWVRHRSPDRFVRNIASIGNSGIYKNIAFEVFAMTAFTALVMSYNGLVTGFTDTTGITNDPAWSSPFLPPLTLPIAVFSLTSPSLGLLLAFRTGTAYQRWDEARKNWGMNINHTRDLVRMGNAYYDRTNVSEEERKADLQHLSLCTWAFVRSMKRHLSPESEDESSFKAELYERLSKDQAQKIIKAAHRPNRALYDLSLAIENLPMHFLRKNEMHAALTIFEDNLGSSERLLTSPVPLIYNRHTARFLFVWLLGVPFALWEPFGFMWNHIGMLPTMSILSLMLFGIEELATQMEEPFTILPMQAFCDKIGNWCNEIVSWEDGDNAVTTNKSYQGRVVAMDATVADDEVVMDGIPVY